MGTMTGLLRLDDSSIDSSNPSRARIFLGSIEDIPPSTLRARTVQALRIREAGRSQGHAIRSIARASDGALVLVADARLDNAREIRDLLGIAAAHDGDLLLAAF